jgi:hypothetical protein
MEFFRDICNGEVDQLPTHSEVWRSAGNAGDAKRAIVIVQIAVVLMKFIDFLSLSCSDKAARRMMMAARREKGNAGIRT